MINFYRKLVFGEMEKPEYPGKISQSRVENQQTQPTYDGGSRNQTRATLLEGEYSHHSANTTLYSPSVQYSPPT